MNIHEHWRHMFCTNVYLTTKVEVFNLENDEIKRVLVMFVDSYFLNKVTCTLNIWETYLYQGGYVSLRSLQYHVIFIKVNILIFNFSICHSYVRASLMAVSTSFPMMQGENFKPHGPDITHDDVIRDSVPFMDKSAVRSRTLLTS